MDKEFELLKRVKAEKGEDFNDVPKRLPNEELDESLKNIIVSYSYLFTGEEKALEEEVQIIVNNIYLLLDILVRMGVHPGFILAALTRYNHEKMQNKDRIAYNNGRKKIGVIFFPYNDVRKELKLMDNINYKGYNTNLSHCFDDILLMNKEFVLPYFDNPTKLSKERKQAYYISIINQRDQIANADELLDESIYIVDLLYTSISILVEMGVNPEKLLINKINEESEKGKHR